MRRAMGGVVIGLLSFAPGMANASTITLGFSGLNNPGIRFVGSALDVTASEEVTESSAKARTSVEQFTNGVTDLASDATASFSLRPVTVNGLIQSTPVTDSGSYSIVDSGSKVLQASQNWVDIVTLGPASDAIPSASHSGGLAINYSGNDSAFGDSLHAALGLDSGADFSAINGPWHGGSHGKHGDRFGRRGDNEDGGHHYGGYHKLDPGPLTDNAVPEPASMLLLGTGLLGLASSVRRRKKAQKG